MAYSTFSISVSPNLHRRYESELSAKILYLSDDIVDFHLYGEGEYIDRIELIYNKEALEANGFKGKPVDLKAAVEFLLLKDFFLPMSWKKKQFGQLPRRLRKQSLASRRLLIVDGQARLPMDKLFLANRLLLCLTISIKKSASLLFRR